MSTNLGDFVDNSVNELLIGEGKNKVPSLETLKDLTRANAPIKKTFIVKSVNEFVDDAKNLPPAKSYINGMIADNDLCILFGPSGAGKSTLAFQLAAMVSSGRNIGGLTTEQSAQSVYWFDFEYNVRQVSRIAKDETFSHNLKRVILDVLNYEGDNELLVEVANMIEEIAQSGLKSLIIIDNITALMSNTERASDAAKLLKVLNKIKFKYPYITLIVIAHTPKRRHIEEINTSSLLGSANLTNLVDSMIAINYSAKGSNIRYIKELKTRFESFVHNSVNIIECQFESEPFTHLQVRGYDTEERNTDTLQQISENEKRAKILDMHKEGNSLRAIGDELGLSHTQVSKIIKSAIT